MKKGSTSLWETVIRIAIAALTAALTSERTAAAGREPQLEKPAGERRAGK